MVPMVVQEEPVMMDMMEHSTSTEMRKNWGEKIFSP